MTQRTGGNIGEARAEGVTTKQETLAIFLACSHVLGSPMRDRLALLDIWEAKDESVRRAYRLRAKRLLAAWGCT